MLDERESVGTPLKLSRNCLPSRVSKKYDTGIFCSFCFSRRFRVLAGQLLARVLSNFGRPS